MTPLADNILSHPTWPQVVLGLGLFALIGFVVWVLYPNE